MTGLSADELTALRRRVRILDDALIVRQRELDEYLDAAAEIIRRRHVPGGVVDRIEHLRAQVNDLTALLDDAVVELETVDPSPPSPPNLTL